MLKNFSAPRTAARSPAPQFDISHSGRAAWLGRFAFV